MALLQICISGLRLGLGFRVCVSMFRVSRVRVSKIRVRIKLNGKS